MTNVSGRFLFIKIHIKGKLFYFIKIMQQNVGAVKKSSYFWCGFEALTGFNDIIQINRL